MCNPSCDSWFTDPTEEEARDSYAELNTREVGIEMFEYFFRERCPLSPLFNLDFELRKSYFYESEFACYKKSIESDEESGNEYTDYDSKTGVRIHILLLYRLCLLCNIWQCCICWWCNICTKFWMTYLSSEVSDIAETHYKNDISDNSNP